MSTATGGTVDMDEIRALQKIELGILKDIDRVCRENNIRYYMGEGSLIGAIRHHGFIPWDDDIDLLMLREDYERFLKIAQDALGDGYQVQHPTTVENYWSPFIKIRLLTESDRFRQKHIAHLTKNNGPLIDIFPVDNIPKMGDWKEMFYARKIRIGRGMITQKLRCVPADTFKRKINRFLSMFFSVKYLHRMIAKAFVSQNSPDNKYAVNYAAYYPVIKETFPREAFGEPVYVPFEDMEVPVPTDYDLVLTSIYGDYMTPPPEGQRATKHHFDPNATE